MAEESFAKPFYSVLVLALACSLLVAGAAVGLRPLQEKNAQLDRKKNILRAAGLYIPKGDVEEQFKAIQTRVIELATGDYVAPEKIDPREFDQVKSALDPQLGTDLKQQQDSAGLGQVEKFSLVYLVKKQGKVDQIILPIRGKGLWSTLFAYVALDADLNTIRGISFYKHGETPGLGGEVENPQWQAGWEGKKVYSTDEQVGLKVVKGQASTGTAGTFEIDGLSGATMTGTGVSHLLQFWFGKHGFQPFLDKVHTQGGPHG